MMLFLLGCEDLDTTHKWESPLEAGDLPRARPRETLSQPQLNQSVRQQEKPHIRKSVRGPESDAALA